MKVDQVLSLKVNRTLLDANFEGYKLSLDKVPVHSREIFGGGVLQAQPSSTSFSYQETRLLSLHNHLWTDPWCQNVAYYFSADRALQAVGTDQQRGTLPRAGTAVLQLAPPIDAATRPQNGLSQSSHLHPSVSFSSQQMAVVSDGCGSLLIAQTGDRSQQPGSWKVVFSISSLPSDVGIRGGYVLLSSVLRDTCLHVLTCHVAENVDATYGPRAGGADATQSYNRLTWLTLREDCSSGSWSVSRTRILRVPGSIQYASLDVPPSPSSPTTPPTSASSDPPTDSDSAISSTGGEEKAFLLLATDRPVEFVYDSLKSVAKPVNGSSGDTAATYTSAASPTRRVYVWTQTDTQLVVRMRVTACDGSGCNVLISPRAITVLGGGETLLRCSLQGSVLTDESSWTLQEDRLEVRLVKDLAADGSSGRWSRLLEDTAGQLEEDGVEALDADAMDRVLEDLAPVDATAADRANGTHTTQAAGSTSGLGPAGDNEECDDFPDEKSVLLRIDGNSHTISHQYNLGAHQYILTTRLQSTELPALCVRHDVDGLIWQPGYTDDGQWQCEHVGTLDAIGYVQVSKVQRKFSVCAPGVSYAAICDAIRHVYLYRQPSPVDGELKNRHTGRRVTQISRQHVLSLEDTGAVLGVSASDTRLLLMTETHLHSLCVS